TALLEAGVSMRDGELDIEHPRAERSHDLAELSLCPNRTERAGARADNGHRLVPQHVRRHRARAPVDRVLQLARNGRVVFRRREEHRVGVCDRRVQARDAYNARMDIVVLVIRWNHLETVVELELDVRAGDLDRGPQQTRVVRVATEAAGA